MKKRLSGLLLTLAASSALFTAPRGDRTFLAHRDELAYQAITWCSSNHYRTEKTGTANGGLLTATPFFTQTTNAGAIAALFTPGASASFNVANAPLKTWAEDSTLTNSSDHLQEVFHKELWSFNIDHAPNSNGVSTGQIPMHGRLTLSPERRSYGVYLGWDQSLANIARGLRLRIMVPVVNALASLLPSDSTATPSSLPVTDGINGAMLTDYFSGDLRKGVSTHSHVLQKELVRGKIARDFIHAFGIADVDMRLDWGFYSDERCSISVGGSIQLPAGTTINSEYLFEPHIGARNHAAAGVSGALQLHAFTGKDMTVRVDLQGDMKYFFEGTERRIVSVYDTANTVVIPASPYRLVMRHRYSGVQPAANVMALDHTIKPGFQLDALLGVSTAWKQWTIDLGYNLYWHQEEKATIKALDTWKDDQYAFAHNHYSMYADTALDRFILGGTSIDSESGVVNHSSATGTSAYHDRLTAVDKHQNRIGANRDGLSTPVRVSAHSPDNTDEAHKAPGAFTSMGGPIQNWRKNTSALKNQAVVTGGDDPAPADATAASTYSGATTDGSGTQPVRYTISSAYLTTGAQITHSLIGGISYRLEGNYPVMLAIGGLMELQESNRNSALEGYRAWAKIGVQF